MPSHTSSKPPSATTAQHAASGSDEIVPNLVSVIIPLYNGEAHLAAQLAALATQTYEAPWQIVIADNGSTDSGLQIVEQWRATLPSTCVVHARDRQGVSHARNVGARSADGDFIAFCDADDIVTPHWLSSLVEAGGKFDVVAGVLDDSINDDLTRHWRGEIPTDRLMTPLGFLPFAPGGNCAMWKPVFEELGGWDEDYIGGSDDVDFSWRATLAGYTIGLAPEARLFYRYREGLRPLWKQFRMYGFSEVRLYHRFRDAGISRPPLRRQLREWKRLGLTAPGMLCSKVERGIWVRQLAYRWGRLRGSLHYHVLLL